MSSNRRWKWNFPNFFTKKGSCGCSNKSIDIIQPENKSKHSHQKHRVRDSASRSVDGGDCCNDNNRNNNNSTAENQSAATAKIIGNSLAVVKVSDDPYSDFRRSMIQMILENEIYSRDDLEELLRCFLELNSPRHHQLIVKAFMEICQGGGEHCTPTLPCSSVD